MVTILFESKNEWNIIMINLGVRRHKFLMTHSLPVSRCYHILHKIIIIYNNYTRFYPDYVEWWSDSNFHLVLFIQYILNSVSVAYICIKVVRGF